MKKEVLILLLLSACAKREAPPVEQKPLLIGPENTTIVTTSSISAGPRIAGTLEPAVQANVRAELSGAITGVSVELGDRVTKGQLIARIEDKAMREAVASSAAAVRAAEEDVALAKKQGERSQSLVNAGAISEHDLEVAKTAEVAATSRLALAHAQLASIQKQLASSTVRSPIAGVVAMRQVSLGDVVSPNTSLFIIIDPSTMRLRAMVPGEDIAALSLGTTVRFDVRGYADKVFEGKIARVAPAADPVTRQVALLVDIANPNNTLLAGLFADGRIASQNKRALVVPLSAIDLSGEEPMAVRVRDRRAERVPLELGIRDDRTERVEVKSGLNAGDVVLTGPARAIASGAAVEVTKAEQAG